MSNATTATPDETEELRAWLATLDDRVETITATLLRRIDDVDEWKARVSEAAGKLTSLAATPDERPDSWEAPHVEALREPLHAILSLLVGDEAKA